MNFSSPLIDVVMELEHLRRLQLAGDTPPAVFFQLKSIFHTLESLGSARIEGNHTTLADYIESKIDNPASPTENLQEVQNIERAMDYVEETVQVEGMITEQLIRELHQMTVSELTREGDKTPGAYRKGNVQIAGAAHLPPDTVAVSGYMQELVEFINRPDAHKYDLLKMALAHHRFCWIHPFGNGNGRVVRLLSYAMMIKYGFNVQTGGRVLNPTAVFCNDRDAYYANLSAADSGSEQGLEAWCFYVLSGIRDELQKVDRLTKYDYLRDEILKPALAHGKSRKLITAQEESVLAMAIARKEFKAADLDVVFPEMSTRQRTYLLSKLLNAQMIRPVREGARSYTINFSNNHLLRGVIHALEQKGFIPPLVKAAT
ncbi:MAG TPA: Fic family protein [Gallionella sp.]|nr:Fic family protein [Gallionella sp.]